MIELIRMTCTHSSDVYQWWMLHRYVLLALVDYDFFAKERCQVSDLNIQMIFDR